jgi:hypothetical protein
MQRIVLVEITERNWFSLWVALQMTFKTKFLTIPHSIWLCTMKVIQVKDTWPQISPWSYTTRVCFWTWPIHLTWLHSLTNVVKHKKWSMNLSSAQWNLKTHLEHVYSLNNGYLRLSSKWDVERNKESPQWQIPPERSAYLYSYNE